MSINIGGEIIKLNVKFDDQNDVRDAEREVKLYIEDLRKRKEEASDRELLAMAAFQFADWYLKLMKIQKDALELVHRKSVQLENMEIDESPDFYDSYLYSETD